MRPLYQFESICFRFYLIMVCNRHFYVFLCLLLMGTFKLRYVSKNVRTSFPCCHCCCPHLSSRACSVLEADHESLLSVKDPCSSGETAFDNGVAVHPNGCGSGSVQAAIVKYTVPYSNKFTSCCNVHDTCFGTCAIHNFSQAF